MTSNRRALLLSATMVAGLLSFSLNDAVAQSYPTRPVTILVPAAAGGPSDSVARIVAESMTRVLGQQVIVENAGGAGGTLGAGRVAKANPDGYTLLLYHVGVATSGTLYRKLPYDPATAFAYVGLIADVPMTIVARPDYPPKDIAELIAYVKQQKDKVTYAHAGVGSASQLCGALLMQALQTQMTTVPYKGTGPAMTDLMGGQVDLMCDQTTNTTGPIKSGKIKGYAVTSKTPVASLPDLPTLDSAGLKGFEVSAWHAIWAPKGTPQEILDKLAAALQAALKDPKVIERLTDLGAVPVAPERATPAALEQHFQAEIAKWRPVLQAAGDYAE